ncbi:MAG: hypothetical protein OHK0038_19460 [Flammeovirgaceae bacterium]
MDELCLPFAIKVTEANLLDNEAGMQAIERLRDKVPCLQKIVVDSEYKDKFVPKKNRWQVERSFSYLNFRLRLFKEVEKNVESAKAMLQITFISFIIHYL